SSKEKQTRSSSFPLFLFPIVGTKKADCKINYNKQIIYIEVTH
ncbi:unnamed protein product, partial [marine sediment metagenome]